MAQLDIVNPESSFRISSDEKRAVIKRRLDAAPLEPADPVVPGRDDLDQSLITDEQLSVKGAAKLGLPVGTVAAGLDSRVLLRDVRIFTTRTSEGVVYEYGVGIRMVVTVSATKLESSLTLPMVAAQAELGIINATAKMTVDGFRDTGVVNLFPKFQQLDVQTYSNWTTSMDSVREYVQAHTEAIFPVLLRKSSANPTEPNYLEAVAISRALVWIANARTLERAIDKVPSDIREATVSVYEQLSPDTDPVKRPTQQAVDLALKLTQWLP